MLFEPAISAGYALLPEIISRLFCPSSVTNVETE